MSLDDELRQLSELLEAEDLPPVGAMSAFAAVSDEAVDAMVSRLAAQFSPPPSGRALARLANLSAPANRDRLVTLYLANLTSPDPRARRASLESLRVLDYPKLDDLALASLRDTDDGVVATAVQILLDAGPDLTRRALLESVRAAHADDPAFHMTNAVLQSHGIGGGP